MPRQSLTPQAAQATATRHALDAKDAADTILAILNGTDRFPDSQRARMLADSAKVLEAAGCYVRRKHADGLLLP